MTSSTNCGFPNFQIEPALRVGDRNFKVQNPTYRRNSNPAIPSSLRKSMLPNNKSDGLEARIIVLLHDSKPEPEDDLEKLESDVKMMAEKILEYRRTLPDQLKATLSSLLAAQRPILTGVASGSDSGPSLRNSDPELMELTNEEENNAAKIRLLKGKFSNNISAMPLVLKRLKECISRIDKLDSCNVVIPPAFEKKRTS